MEPRKVTRIKLKDIELDQEPRPLNDVGGPFTRPKPPLMRENEVREDDNYEDVDEARRRRRENKDPEIFYPKSSNKSSRSSSRSHSKERKHSNRERSRSRSESRYDGQIYK